MRVQALFCSLRSFLFALIGYIALLSWGLPQAFAQSDPAAGIQPFSTNEFGVDLASGNVNVNIPIRSKSTLPIALVGNFHAYQNPIENYLWDINIGLTPTSNALVSNSVIWSGNSRPFGTCLVGGIQVADTLVWGFSVQDSSGALHPIGGVLWPPKMDTEGCYPPPATGTTSDGSGYTVVTGGSVNNGSWIIYDKGGNIVDGALITPDGVVLSRVGTNGAFDDALTSTAVLTPTNSGYSYTDASGKQQQITVNNTQYYQWTAFTCDSGAGNIQNSHLSNFPTQIVLPENAGIYGITYEQTPGKSSSYVTGRIASITYPSGGSISYAYQGGLEYMCSGGTNVLQVTVNDGQGHNSIYTYTYSSKLIRTDPAGNQSLYTFSGEYLTQLATYQGGCPTSVSGCTSGGTLLRTVTTCYNGANCTGKTTPSITQLDVYTSYNGSSNNLVETKFDSYGNTIEVKKFDFGTATPPTTNPLSDTVINYGQSWNSSSNSCTAYPSGTYIFNTPCYIYTMNSSGTVMASTQIIYSDTGHPTATTKLTSGTASLMSSATYNLNGTLATATDVNQNTVSTYYYNGTGGCNNLLPTSLTIKGLGLPSTGLTTSSQWDCNGAVTTQTTDANGQPTTTNYSVNSVADPLYRPLSMVDALNNTTSFGYKVTSVESTMNFGTSSTSDALATVDGLGRNIFAQKKQTQCQGTSCSFDSTQTVYTWNSTGLVTTQYMPYSGTSAQPAPAGTAFTTTQFDALSRPLSVTDGGGGTTTYTYTQNDVLVTTGPTQSFKKQFEYDGLGRLTSVCEVTAGTQSWPGGNCAQANALTGYWTKYTYDALGNLLTVKQNSQGTTQNRTYTYDGLSRLTSESNPETGTTTYYYDSYPAPGVCGGVISEPGDLMLIGKANGDWKCFITDGLHRVTDGEASGTDVGNCFRFRYDNSQGAGGSIPSGVSVSNPFGRLVEAETDNCPALPVPKSDMFTDEWLSYDADGRLTDFYEKTPDSGGYYHTTAGYWANGAVKTLSGVGSHSWSFGEDGEGRPNSALDGTTTLVSATGTGYNYASQPTNVALGSGDSDGYTYDPNTGRMSAYQFNVGATPKIVTGTLNWNPNWTLGSLVISDAFNSANTQNCGYTYDDLVRLQSVSCGPTNQNGATWGQTFAYDPFGNISKSVPQSMTGISWLPGYNTNNQYILGGTSYDGNGNLTNDSFNTYSWDAYGHVVGINLNGSAPINITYDALDRAVEVNTAGTKKEILYSPIGKLALMAGTNANNIFLPLPGGEQATYTSNTIRFRHYDWEGSARFESNMSEQEYGDVAYAPFGETYSIKNTPYLAFTGQNQDTISGTYDFLYREYNPVQGRWISPDPAGFGATDPTNPQSWNRYAYVSNNSLNLVDPSGLQMMYAGYSGTGLCSIYPSATQCVESQLLEQLQLFTGNDLTLLQYEALYVARLNQTVNTPPSGNWVPAGGDYQGTGCLRQTGGDTVWCPGPGASIPSQTDVQRLQNIFNATLNRMNQRGQRRPGTGPVNGLLNDLEYWVTNYQACTGQSYICLDSLNAAANTLDANWTFSIQSNFWHTWVYAASSNPADPSVTMDPLYGTFTVNYPTTP